MSNSYVITPWHSLRKEAWPFIIRDYLFCGPTSVVVSMTPGVLIAYQWLHHIPGRRYLTYTSDERVGEGNRRADAADSMKRKLLLIHIPAWYTSYLRHIVIISYLTWTLFRASGFLNVQTLCMGVIPGRTNTSLWHTSNNWYSIECIVVRATASKQ